ncbi:MAG: PKD domain-containing protein, partial [Bacteroidota bacterium]
LPYAAWNIGDGNGSTQYSPTHTYTNPGVYTVTLTGSDGPFSDVATQSVTVLPGTSFTINGLTDFCDPGQPLVTTHAASVTGIGISYQWTAT